MMRETNPNFPNPLSVKIDANPAFFGLDEFQKGLERLFFAQATIKVWNSGQGMRDLVLHLKSPIRFVEVLHHHRKGHWGAHSGSGREAGTSRLEEMLQTLESGNNRPVDIEELCLELHDIVLVIRKCGTRSIAREFDHLLETLAAHFVYLTQGMVEMPYEIYIPVVEETGIAEHSPRACGVSDFYGYWGVYFDSEADGLIYDLRGRKILDQASLHFDSQTSR